MRCSRFASMSKTIVISTNSAWNIINFRGGLIDAIKQNGHRVVAISPSGGHGDRLAALGIEHVPIEIDSAGLSPMRDLSLLFRYRRLFRRIGTDLFLGYTAKPNIYGSIAAQSLGIPTINNISGLGTAFIDRRLLMRIVPILYRIALRRSATVFFQNPDDRALFLARKLVRSRQARLVPGSGIDLRHFEAAPSEHQPGSFTFLLMGRLLWQKGVAEYVEAARIVRGQSPDVRFQLVGFIDAANRSAVGRGDVDRWAAEGIVEYVGETDDVRRYIAAADCVVLPSYREGLPRALLEGAAMARPLIATDVPGCRQIVEHGINGYLCSLGDARSLASAMLAMIGLDEEARSAMGAAGRCKVEAEFAEDRAIAAYRTAIAEALTVP